jgi:hypothetical protein
MKELPLFSMDSLKRFFGKMMDMSRNAFGAVKKTVFVPVWRYQSGHLDAIHLVTLFDVMVT